VVVVILMGQSLFAEGVVNRLQQHLDKAELQVVDTRQPDALEQITAIQPSAVIIDESDPIVSQGSIMDKLLATVPTLIVIRLDSQSSWIQIVQWNRFQVTEVRDLLEVIEPPSPFSINQSVTEVS